MEITFRHKKQALIPTTLSKIELLWRFSGVPKGVTTVPKGVSIRYQCQGKKIVIDFRCKKLIKNLDFRNANTLWSSIVAETLFNLAVDRVV